jgi:hypothetical protein
MAGSLGRTDGGGDADGIVHGVSQEFDSGGICDGGA